MIVFTSICTNYAHKARTLAKSVKENIPDAKFIVCLTEREVKESMDYPYFDEVVLSKDMWEGNFNRYIYKHAIVEACIFRSRLLRIFRFCGAAEVTGQ